MVEKINAKFECERCGHKEYFKAKRAYIRKNCPICERKVPFSAFDRSKFKMMKQLECPECGHKKTGRLKLTTHEQYLGCPNCGSMRFKEVK